MQEAEEGCVWGEFHSSAQTQDKRCVAKVLTVDGVQLLRRSFLLQFFPRVIVVLWLCVCFVCLLVCFCVYGSRLMVQSRP